jgi:N-acetylglucosaminyldiphosphoundecaprenol N-acetyl-beta-D-mannosaminyltransferase
MTLRVGIDSWSTAQAGEGVALTEAATKTTSSSLTDIAEPSETLRHVPAVGDSASSLPMIRLHGVDLHQITEAQTIEHIFRNLEFGRGGVVVTPNLDHIRRCRQDLTFGALVSEADLVVADGMPLVWASRVQGTPLPQRVAGSDLISTLSAAAAERGRSIYLLGGDAGTADAAARILVDRSPNLKVAGTYYPPLGFESDRQQMNAIRADLTRTKPDIVYVALGSPKQERLIHDLKKVLPQAWWLGVGVSFSFLTGDVRRAPNWMRKCGLEWVHRLVQEPRRLFKRYVLVGLPFAAALFGRAAFNGINYRLGRYQPPSINGASRDLTRAYPFASDALDCALSPADSTPTSESLAPTDSMESAGMSALLSDGITASGNHAPQVIHGRQPTSDVLRRLKGLVLLAGSVRPTPLTSSIHRSVLDLPVESSTSILNHWLSDAAELAKLVGIEKLPVRVLLDRQSSEPRSALPQFQGAFTVERDLSEYRGTGGILSNLAMDYADDDLILIANAAQILLEPLQNTADALAQMGGVVSLVGHQDGTPSNLMLLTCKALRVIPNFGFVDMKEQALPSIAAKFDVRVVQYKRPTGMPVRSLADYVAALRSYHGRGSGRKIVSDPLGEDWRPIFAIAEPGTTVDATARVHDSVILAGATVEAGAVVVRSVVCPNGIVRKDRKAVDVFVTASGETSGRSSVRAVRPATNGNAARR